MYLYQLYESPTFHGVSTKSTIPELSFKPIQFLKCFRTCGHQNPFSTIFKCKLYQSTWAWPRSNFLLNITVVILKFSNKFLMFFKRIPFFESILIEQLKFPIEKHNDSGNFVVHNTICGPEEARTPCIAGCIFITTVQYV